MTFCRALEYCREYCTESPPLRIRPKGWTNCFFFVNGGSVYRQEKGAPMPVLWPPYETRILLSEWEIVPPEEQ